MAATGLVGSRAPLSEAVPVPAPAIGERTSALIIAEGLAPLVGGRVQRGARLSCPGSVQRDLLEAHRQCLARHVFRQHQLAPLLGELARREIACVLLKGTALAQWAYESPGDRGMGDIDLLVAPTRWSEVLGLMKQMGGALCMRPMTARLDYAIPVQFNSGFRLDLHRALAPAHMFSPDIDEIFRNSTRLGEHGRTLEKHACFVALAIHAAKHGYVLPLRSVVDGLVLLRHHLDAARVEEIARRWSARRATARWIQLLRRLGLEEPRWFRVERSLLRGRSAASALPAHLPRSRTGELWGTERERWQQALLSVDAPWRALGTIAGRAGLRLGNQLSESVANRLSRAAASALPSL